MTEVTEVIREMMQAFRRAGVEVPDTVAQVVEVEIRTQFAGDRVYVSGHPKRTRAVQLARLNLTRTRDIAEQLGCSERHARRLLGKK